MNTITNDVIYSPAHFVPPNAVVFGAIGETSTPVTKETPLPVLDLAGGISLIERLNREGDPFSVYASSMFSSFLAPAGAGVLGPAGFPIAPPPGRAFFIQHANFWSTTPLAARMWVGGSNWNTGVGTATQSMLDAGFACGPSYPASFPVNVFVRSSDKPNIGIYIKQWLDPNAAGTHYVGAGGVGFQLADSINFDAKKVLLFLGDSLWNGTGPSDVTTCVPWLVNNFYREAGIDCRYILKAYSGSTTGGHETYRQGGKYEFDQVDAIFYQLGTNDATQAMQTSASMVNVQTLIAWKQKRYPNAKLVIFGPPPLQDDAKEATLAALRAAEAAYVEALGDGNVHFCSLANTFDRTAAGNYLASDGAAGTRIHPNDTALALAWNGGYLGNAGLRAWLTANLPAI